MKIYANSRYKDKSAQTVVCQSKHSSQFDSRRQPYCVNPILIAHAHRLVCTYVICVCHMTGFTTTRLKMVGAGINVFLPILFATKYVCRYMHPGDTKMCQYSLCSSDSACSQTSLKTYCLHMT